MIWAGCGMGSSSNLPPPEAGADEERGAWAGAAAGAGAAGRVARRRRMADNSARMSSRVAALVGAGVSDMVKKIRLR